MRTVEQFREALHDREMQGSYVESLGRDDDEAGELVLDGHFTCNDLRAVIAAAEGVETYAFACEECRRVPTRLLVCKAGHGAFFFCADDGCDLNNAIYREARSGHEYQIFNLEPRRG